MNQTDSIKKLINSALNNLRAKNVSAITIEELQIIHNLLSSKTYYNDESWKKLEIIGDSLYKYWIPFKEVNSHARYVIWSLQKMSIYNELREKTSNIN